MVYAHIPKLDSSAPCFIQSRTLALLAPAVEAAVVGFLVGNADNLNLATDGCQQIVLDWNRRMSSVVAVSGDRFRNAANRLQVGRPCLFDSYYSGLFSENESTTRQKSRMHTL
jgi:hypothetical protein